MSKIPEGATHTYTESSGTSFRKMSGSYWLGYADGDWIILNNPASHCYVPIQADPEWTGEGLPPVGLDVEVMQGGLPSVAFDWEACKILAINIGSNEKPQVITRDFRGDAAIYYPGIDNVYFRSIRTVEQIAAEKRDGAIKEMQRLVGSCNTFPFAELYDYGYRLQVEK